MFSFEELLEKLKKIFIESDVEEPIVAEEEQVTSEQQEEVSEQPMPDPEPEQEPVLVKLTEFRGCIEAASRLMERTPVFLDLGAVDYAVAKRALDFLGGVIYALKGTLKQVSDSVFYLTVSATVKEADALKAIYEAL